MLTSMDPVTRLKLAREARGLRAYEVARAVGITRTQYSLIENNQALPAPWLAMRIATVIGLEAGDLFPGGGDYENREEAHQGGRGAGPRDAPAIRPRRRCRSAEGAEEVGE